MENHTIIPFFFCYLSGIQLFEGTSNQSGVNHYEEMLKESNLSFQSHHWNVLPLHYYILYKDENTPYCEPAL